MSQTDGRRVSLAIVVVAYDMARELPRTLHSLSREYQRGVADLDYEVLVVDNGSPEAVPRHCVERWGPGFRLHRIDDASPSPAGAVNEGVRRTSSDLVGLLVDGARLLTPGVIRNAVGAFSLHDDPIVATLGFHLGPNVQSRSSAAGYTTEVEDGLLEKIGWPEDGYRLFEIASLAGSSRDGWFWPIAESNCLVLRRETFDKLGGFDERFQSPGGGLVNLDFYRRACDLPGTSSTMLLGEGSFHQLHGGVTTGGSGEPPRLRFNDFKAEYEQIVAKPYARPQHPVTYLGSFPPQALPFVEFSAGRARRLAASEDSP